ncbi:MAG: hypothetical protein EOR04_10465 [Mesorhizobium sp.]|uniref:hypothetical protein n=1 Tax=Mesorhizobium sp. TaxID=1871066 RepID=UPI000FE75EA8|nr:hypothetical protein [Mesorhizobium sp.]RWP42605.1 MAG: hypothetical protein EOR04_10465 [Mesorhizobium sp.]
MPIDIKYLEENPIEVPKGGIKYFDIVGDELLTTDLEFYASFDQAGARRDNEIKVYVDKFGTKKEERLPMIAEATEKADSDPAKVRWVVIKLTTNKNIEDAAQGLIVI